MEKKITILGQEVTVTFNMATEIAYEEITDQAFNLAGLEKTKNQFALALAAINSTKKNAQLPQDFTDRLLNEATAADIKTLNDAVAECMVNFLHLPATSNDPALDGKINDGAAGNGEEEKN